MLITGEYNANPKYTRPQYSQSNYGSGWYGANTAKRSISVVKNALDAFENDPLSIRFSPQDSVETNPNTYQENLLGFSQEYIDTFGSKNAPSLTLQQYEAWKALDINNTQERVTKALKLGLAVYHEMLIDQNQEMFRRKDVDKEELEQTLVNQVAEIKPGLEEKIKDAALRYTKKTTQLFPIFDRNQNGLLDLKELAAIHRLHDGIAQYLQTFDPTFRESKETQRLEDIITRYYARAFSRLAGKPVHLDIRAQIDGKISFFEENLTSMYLREGSPEKLANILDHIQTELQLDNAAKAFQAQKQSS